MDLGEPKIDLERAALAYAERGWLVFPVAARGKLPAIASPHPAGDPDRPRCHGECGRDGHGLYDATTDPKRIARWWARAPESNIGLRTGVLFDVLDVDGERGQQSLVEEMARDGAKRLGSGPWSLTGGGGDHLLYAPTGAGNRAGLLDHVDWRGAGGYIVAPPSIHPTGTAYEWYEGPETSLAPAPAWLAALVNPPPPTSTSPNATAKGGTYAQRALEAELGRVATASDGGRNNQLNRSAFSLGQLVAAGLLERRPVAEQLLLVALRTGLSEPEAVATIRSGLEKGLLSPRRVSS